MKKAAGQDFAKQETGWTRSVPINRYVVFALLGAGGFLLDLLTKAIVFAWLGMPAADASHEWWLIDGYVGIQTAINQGALFGMGQGWGLGFAVLSVVAGVGIAYWLFVRGAAKDLLLTFSLGCVTAGILGNLFDRLGLWHRNPLYDLLGVMQQATVPAGDAYGVRDWILFRWPGVFTWPNFNIADSLLVCGAALLLWHAFFRSEKPQRTQEKPEAGSI